MLSKIFSTALKFLLRHTDDSEETFSFKIITKCAGVCDVAVPHDGNVKSMKRVILTKMMEVVENFPYKNDEFDETLSRMKLIRIRTQDVMENSKNLNEFDLQNNEEFFLLFHRDQNFSQPTPEESFSAPTQEQIIEKTSHLPLPDHTPVFNPNFLFLQDDLRKVFVTLAKESAYILCIKPESVKILNYFRAKIHNYMKNHENAYKVMYKLGFSQDNVSHAMTLNANNYKLALDWLIDNVKEHENLRLSKSPRSSLISNKRTSILSASFDLASASIHDRLDGLLGIVEFYSEMDEPVSEMNIRKMVHMGYDIEVAREALRIVKNNIGAACDYLSGYTSGSIMELRVGLDESSPIYDNLMKLLELNQLLTIPESFIYFNKLLKEHILEWDPDINNGDLVRQIILTYHKEKRILVANQFNNSKIPVSAISAPLT